MGNTGTKGKILGVNGKYMQNTGYIWEILGTYGKCLESLRRYGKCDKYAVNTANL